MKQYLSDVYNMYMRFDRQRKHTITFSSSESLCFKTINPTTNDKLGKFILNIMIERLHKDSIILEHNSLLIQVYHIIRFLSIVLVIYFENW